MNDLKCGIYGCDRPAETEMTWSDRYGPRRVILCAADTLYYRDIAGEHVTFREGVT